MKLATKVALTASVSAVVACGFFAYAAATDEGRDFVRGSSKKAELPSDLLFVGEEIDDEYEDTDEETEFIQRQQVLHVVPLMEDSKQGRVYASTHRLTPIPRDLEYSGYKDERPEARDDQDEKPKLEQLEEASNNELDAH